MTGLGNDHVDDGCSSGIVDSITKKKVGNYSLSVLLKNAREIVEDRTKDWETINDLKSEERIPKFHRDGTYEFCFGAMILKNANAFGSRLHSIVANNWELIFVPAQKSRLPEYWAREASL
jgi:hypothetical protein